ncbi:MSLNL protein, partial [Crypturellus undulatus]|nr:MSLNL protein [Crypturellus undulatus]
LSAVHNRSCKAFYALASRGNLELLPRGSMRRTRLLRGALACWGASSPALSAEQLGGLGALVCDMEPVTVTASHPHVLENLKLCRALSGAQRDALNAVLLAGATAYGHPSSWDVRSLHSLGTLMLSLNQTVLRSLAEEVRRALRRRIAATYRGQDSIQQHRSRVLLGALASIKVSSSPRRRARRSTGRCPSVPITAGALADPLLLLSYESSEEFDLCLDERVLRSSLALLLEQPLTAGFLRVVQRRLGQMYPEGIPEEQLKLLGPLSHLYTPEEISTWTVTSNATLLALLNPRVGKWTAPQAQQLITRYLDLGGILTGSLLQSIGGSTLCRLDEEHISCITPEAIGCAGPLDISSCSQAKKNQLYAKAQEAFASQAGTPAYYSLIQPYLGGAPAKDLKELAKTGISMDIDTFTALNPEELQQLSVTDVKNLLGINLPDLKQVENLPAVINWIRRQDQWELDHILGIGLQGGIVKPSPTGSATSVAVTPSITVVPTTAVLATTALPAGTTTSSHTAMGSSTSTHVSPTPNAITLTPLHAQSTLSSAGGSPVTTSRVTTRPALLPSSTSPCSVHPATTSMTTRS